MSSSNTFSKNLKPLTIRLIVLAAFLPSFTVLAAAPENGSVTADFMPEQTTSSQATAPQKINHHQPSGNQRAFKDDYERHLITVTRPKSTKTIWLREEKQTAAKAPSQAELIWQRQQDRSE